MLNRSSSRPPVQRFVPSPPPSAGAGRPGAGRADRALPPLPTHPLGAPPRRPPGAGRPAPRQGGIHGVGAPPELRRRVPGGVHAAPGAAAAAALIRAALHKAQHKLLASQRKLQAGAAAVRAQLGARR